MARYIDADNLVERLKVSPIFQDFNTDGYFIRDMVIDLVGCQPIADVVPKSKYDLAVAEREANVRGFTEELETLRDTNEHLAVMLMEAKAEVARAFRQRMNEKMGKHTHLLGKEYVQRILREVEKEMVGEKVEQL